MWSDAVDVRVRAGDQVAISVYAPNAPISSKNFFAYAYAAPGMYISTPGDHARDSSGRAFPALTVDDTDYPLTNTGYHPGQVTAAMRDIVKRAHARGILVIGGTLIPMGKEPGSVQEVSRQAVNSWIRSSGTFDEVIDLDAMVRDPTAPWRIFPAWTAPAFNGNFYHPNAMGHTVMGQEIALGVFRDLWGADN